MTRSLRNLGLAAAAAWLVLPGYGVWELARTDDDGWQVGYLIYELALVVAAGLTVVLVAALTGASERPRLRKAGLAVGSLGTAFALVGAWAAVVWMPLLGLTFALLALAAPGAVRRPVAMLASGLFAGFAIVITGAVATGSVGDLTEAIAFAVTAAAAAASLGSMAFSPRPVVPAQP